MKRFDEQETKTSISVQLEFILLTKCFMSQSVKVSHSFNHLNSSLGFIHLFCYHNTNLTWIQVNHLNFQTKISGNWWKDNVTLIRFNIFICWFRFVLFFFYFNWIISFLTITQKIEAHTGIRSCSQDYIATPTIISVNANNWNEHAHIVEICWRGSYC